MGWHKCINCGSKDWTLHCPPNGCDKCDPDLEKKMLTMNIKDIKKIKKMAKKSDKNLVGGVSTT